MRLQPIERRSLAGAVMEQLANFIKGGSISPGEALPSQHELARQLSVSRPVLREALQGLASIGMIEIRPGSGCYVRDPDGGVHDDVGTLFEAFTHETALEVLEARMVVEVELAVLAAERATGDDFAQMETILDRLERAVERGQPTSQVTSEFHQALARAGQNAVLFRMAQLLAGPRLVQGLRVEYALPDVSAQEYQSHRRLFDAVRSGDPNVARADMRAHLEIAHGWEEQIASLRRSIGAAANT